jgi:hypothetical protein
VKKYLVFLRSVRRLLVAACVVPSSPIFVTLMKEAQGSSETSVHTRATRRNNPEDTILHSHRRENLKSYIYYICLNFFRAQDNGQIQKLSNTGISVTSQETMRKLQIQNYCRFLILFIVWD